MVTLGLPQALWFLLTIPILLLLHMLRARREARTVSSTLLWERTARDQRARMPVRRLERSLLLLLQILAATLLALALARPALTVEGVAGSALVLVFDTSLSMQARDVTPTRFGAAQAEALRLMDRLGRGRPVMIIEAGAGPRVVTEFTADRLALARGIQRVASRVARGLNRRWRVHGPLFADRYHGRAVRTPREARNLLAYVLLNAHKEAARSGAGVVGPRPCAR
jgi:hypothetical protein